MYNSCPLISSNWVFLWLEKCAHTAGGKLFFLLLVAVNALAVGLRSLFLLTVGLEEEAQSVSSVGSLKSEMASVLGAALYIENLTNIGFHTHTHIQLNFL